MRNLAIATLAGVVCIGTVSAANAADVRGKPRPVVVPAAAPVVVQHGPLLHPVLWCAGGLVVSAIVHNPVPAIVGCTIGAVKVVHHY